MSVTSTTRIVEEAGNGVKVAFDFSFKIFAQTDLVCFKKSALSVFTEGVLNVDYTVSFNTALETGTVTWTVAPVTGGSSVIARVTAQNQGSQLPREGPMPEQTIQNIVDKLALEVQELNERVDRIPQLPIVPPLPDTMELGAPVDQKGVRWQDNGDGTWTLETTTFDPDEAQADAAAAAAAAAASAVAAAASLASVLALIAAIPVQTGTFAALDAAATTTFFIAMVTDQNSIKAFLGNRSLGEEGWILLGGWDA